MALSLLNQRRGRRTRFGQDEGDSSPGCGDVLRLRLFAGQYCGNHQIGGGCSSITHRRRSDTIARYAGTIGFIAAHAIWFAMWVILNAGIIPGIGRFDPFPYPFLTFVVSLEAIFL